MTTIVVKGSCTILGEIRSEIKSFTFKVNFLEVPVIFVTVIPKENQIDSSQEIEISDELLKVLVKDNYNDISGKLELELSALTSRIF